MDKEYSYDELLEKLEELEKKLMQYKQKDHLTRVYNRKHFYEKAHEAFSRTSRYNKDLSILILDIKNMESVNKTYGYDAGDYLLKTVAEKLKDFIRGTDVSGRISGDKFAVLMENTGKEDIEKASVRVERFLNALSVQYEENIIKFSISLGISSYVESDNSIYEIINRAEKDSE